jgi:hypothetical protein
MKPRKFRRDQRTLSTSRKVGEVFRMASGWIVLFSILCTAACDSRGAGPAHRIMKIDWKQFRDAGEVQRYLDTFVPRDSPVEKVVSFTKDQGLLCSPLQDAIFCSAPAPSKSFWIGAKWMIEFHFDAGILTKISVKLGLTGP